MGEAEVVSPELQFEPDDFANAGTISSWLEALPDHVKLETAKAVFGKLVEGATQPRKSSSQACVKLCGFVQLCTKSNHDGVRHWAFEEGTAMRLFEFYIEWNEHDQHRSMRLVLDVLTTTFLRNPDREVGAAIETGILDTLVSIISRQSTRPLVKSSLHCVVHFLNKQAITLEDVAATYGRVQPDTRELLAQHLWESLVAVMFSWMELHYVCPIAGKFIVHIFHGLQSMRLDGFGVTTWQNWIQTGLTANMDRLESVKNYVLTPLFAADREWSLQLLKIYNTQNSNAAGADALSGDWALLRLAILEVGKKAGLVDEPDSKIIDEDTNTVTLESQVLEGFLVHPSHVVRSSGLSLLVSSASTTKPVSKETFELLKSHLAAYYADHDAKFRNEILSFTKDLINRVKYVIAVAVRSLAKLDAKTHQAATDGDISRTAKKQKNHPENLISDKKEAQDVWVRHTSFLKWYREFLKGELIPTASYQRHIMALKALLPVLKLGKHASGSDESLDMDMAQTVYLDPTFMRLLLDLLMDPFDDVRETTMVILQMAPHGTVFQDVPGHDKEYQNLQDVLKDFCNHAAQLAGKTGRADHGNGAARARGLLCTWSKYPAERVSVVWDICHTLEGKISRARQDLGRAAAEDSLHGGFAALGYCWQALAKLEDHTAPRQGYVDLQRRMVGCCQSAWNLVKHVLCDDSPEGHLPEEMEDIEGLDTKDLLSYSFRAIHESSNLMEIIVNGLRTRSIPSAMLPPLEVFHDVGQLTFDQLTRLRHRGAFTTVTSTFTTCCQVAENIQRLYLDLTENPNYLRQWYDGTMECIKNEASTTRRSAGIPSLVIGILAANSVWPSFKEVYMDLETIAKLPARTAETDGSNLPQVHALNCLRGIFRSSLLSKKAERYLPITLELAANSLKSEVWAIRNCGLLLLRSLIDCLFGTGESKLVTESGWDGHTIRISYNKYPRLPGMLLNLLSSAGSSISPGLDSATAEAVFPVLDIIRRAGPPDECREELFGYIKEYLRSQLWHVREIAARTLCSFLLRDGWIVTVQELLEASRTSGNGLHGALLATRFIVERKAETDVKGLIDDIPKLITVLEQLARTGGAFQTCEDAQTVFLQILKAMLNLSGRRDFIPELPITSVSSPLLQLELSLQGCYLTGRDESGITAPLRDLLFDALQNDTDIACRMLQVIPDAWGHHNGPRVSRELCNIYLDIYNSTEQSEARNLALVNMKVLMDDLLHRGDLSGLASTKDLISLIQLAGSQEMSPGLSNAVTTVSGPLMATMALRKEPWIGAILKSWGNTLADALDVDNTFDTRFAAAEALRSFCSAAGSLCRESEHLPLLMALYDALNDDDDEVRDVAAAATATLLGKSMTYLEAADCFLDWLRVHFGELREFRNIVCWRMVGQPSRGEWTPAKDLLKEATHFDDSLFAAEEQNLFIDEVRESKRFSRLFVMLPYELHEENCIVDWVEDGFKALFDKYLVDDGRALGIASDQHVFAIIARLIITGTALDKKRGVQATSLPHWDLFKRDEKLVHRRFHGYLVSMADGVAGENCEREIGKGY